MVQGPTPVRYQSYLSASKVHRKKDLLSHFYGGETAAYTQMECYLWTEQVRKQFESSKYQNRVTEVFFIASTGDLSYPQKVAVLMGGSVHKHKMCL